MAAAALGRRSLLLCYLPLVLLSGCGDPAGDFPTDDENTEIMGLHKIHTPPDNPTNKYANDPNAAALGEKLFADVRFSKCGDKACLSCHVPPWYVSNAQYPVGCSGPTERNGPSLVNAPFSTGSGWYYWDGRKDWLWSHAAFPLLNGELNATPDSVKATMAANYATDYKTVFGVDPASETDSQRVVANFGKAIEAFIRAKLIKVDAPFDDQLDHFEMSFATGNQSVIEADPLFQKLFVFVRRGKCIVCHKGPTFSDDLFHNLGVDQLVMPPTDHGHQGGITMVQNDVYNGAGKYSDDPEVGMQKLATLSTITLGDVDGGFKTPSLRNVAMTAPYMHTGGKATLDDVIDFYNRGGDPTGTFVGKRAVTIQPLNLTSDEHQALKDLLMSLTSQ